MTADWTEMNDLAGQQFDKLKTLAAKCESWAARASVLPLGGWRGQPAGKEDAK